VTATLSIPAPGSRPATERPEHETRLVATIRDENLARSLRGPVEPLRTEQRPTPVGEAVSSTPWGRDIWFAVQFTGTTVSVHRSGFGPQTRYAITDDRGAELSDRTLGSIAARTNQNAAAAEGDVLELGQQARGHLVAIADAIATNQLNATGSELRRHAPKVPVGESVQGGTWGGRTL
jgi:hypothetical protein